MISLSNPRRKRSGRRGHRRSFKFNVSRRHRRNPGRRSHRGMRRSRRNPGIVKRLTAGYSMPALKMGALIAGGAIAANFLAGLIRKYVPVDFIKTGYGKYIGDLGGIAALSLTAGMAAPALMFPLVIGGLGNVIRKLAEQAVPQLATTAGLHGLADWLTPADASYGMQHSLGYMGDYLSPRNVQALPTLGGMGSMQQMAEMAELSLVG